MLVGPDATLIRDPCARLCLDEVKDDRHDRLGRADSDADPHRPEADALSYVGGYTCFNDISARDQQNAQLGSSQIIDWFSTKMFDRATPVGPGIVPASAVGDPQALEVRLYLNGERLQDGPTTPMVHPVASLVAFVSSRTELLPGDVIATGTPAGVGKARGIRLKPGDEVSVEIAGVGRLTKPLTVDTKEPLELWFKWVGIVNARFVK